MSAAAPNPKNLMLLAGLGIAVYWFMSRRALAATPLPVSGQAISNPYVAQGVAGLVGGIANLFKPSAGVGTYDGRAAVPWDTSTGGGSANNPSAYLGSSDLDGVAFNPTSGSVYDAFNNMDALSSIGGYAL